MAGITMTGTSGIDVGSLIRQLTELKQMEVTRIAARKTTASAQLEAYNSLGRYLSEFSQKAASISKASDFNVFQTSSSNSDAVSVTASSGAPMGNYSIKVTQLAEREKLASTDGLISDANKSLTDMLDKDGDPIIFAGKFTINGTEIELKEGETLNDLRAKINNAKDADGKSIGVTATVLKASDGNFRLILTADESGEKGVEYSDVEGNVLQSLGFLTGTTGAAVTLDDTFESAGDIRTTFKDFSDAGGGAIKFSGTSTTGNPVDKEITITSGMTEKMFFEEVKKLYGNVNVSFGEDGKLIIKDNEKPENSNLDVGSIDDSAFVNKVVTNYTGTKAKPLNEGKDAEFSIDGIEMTSTKNTITDVVAGLSIELKKKTGVDESVEVSVKRDEGAIAKKVEDMINMYNSLLRFQNEQTKYEYDNTKRNADGSIVDPVKGALFGDSTIKSVTSSLRAIFSQAFNTDATFSSLAQIGIKTDYKTGMMELDQEKFKEALEKDFDAVVGMFVTQGTTDNTNISFGKASSDTKEGTYEIREFEGKFQIRLMEKDKDGKYVGTGDWITGTRTGDSDVYTFNSGPAKGLMITASEGSGNATLKYSKGLAAAIDEKVKQLNDFADGVVATKKDSINARIKTIDNQVEAAQKRVDRYREQLVKQFSVMEQKIMLLNSQMSAMSSQLSSFMQ